MTFRRVRAIDSTFERYGYWLPIFIFLCGGYSDVDDESSFVSLH